jgi:anti-anti-sigma regulatory factor
MTIEHAAAATLPIGGSLTIPRSEETRRAIMEALNGGASLIIDCDEAVEVDVSFLQILIAAQRTAARSLKHAALKAPPSGALAAALRACGFSPPPGATALAQILPL